MAVDDVQLSKLFSTGFSRRPEVPPVLIADGSRMRRPHVVRAGEGRWSSKAQDWEVLEGLPDWQRLYYLQKDFPEWWVHVELCTGHRFIEVKVFGVSHKIIITTKNQKWFLFVSSQLLVSEETCLLSQIWIYLLKFI